MATNKEYDDTFDAALKWLMDQNDNGDGYLLIKVSSDDHGISMGGNIKSNAQPNLLRTCAEKMSKGETTKSTIVHKTGEHMDGHHDEPDKEEHFKAKPTNIDMLMGVLQEAMSAADTGLASVTSAVRKMANGADREEPTSLDPNEAKHILHYIKFLQDHYQSSPTDKPVQDVAGPN